MKTIAYGLLPIILIIGSLVGWKIYGWKNKLLKIEEQRAMTVGTIVLFLYLIYPSITSRTLGLWKCEYIEHVGTIFIVDPETLCTDDIQTYQNTVGILCILCYIIRLPMCGLAILYKFRNKLNQPRTRMRFGLLYDGFVRDRYMHEGWVVFRKLLLILIGIFTDKLQVILALGIVGILLVHTAWSQPFETANLSRLEMLLLLCSFLTLWVGGIFTVYPNCVARDSFTAFLCSSGEAFVFVYKYCLFRSRTWSICMVCMVRT